MAWILQHVVNKPLTMIADPQLSPNLPDNLAEITSKAFGDPQRGVKDWDNINFHLAIKIWDKFQIEMQSRKDLRRFLHLMPLLLNLRIWNIQNLKDSEV